MNILVLILVLAVLVILLVLIVTQDQKDYSSYRQAQNLIDSIEVPQAQAYIDEHFDQGPLRVVLGKRLFAKFYIPVIVIAVLSIVVLGPLLTSVSLGIVLGSVITLAYVLRIYYHLAANYRTKLLSQIERILRAIRNQLSSGTTLDYAVVSVLHYLRNEEPIGMELARFINASDANFLETFPQWLNLLRQKYKLHELSEAAQLLGLELKFSNNQEHAFLIAIDAINARQALNRRSQNTIFVTFLSLDFMVLAFFGVLFYVIPSFAINAELNWWLTERREWIVFVSGMVLWLAYSITVAIMTRRLA